MELENVPTGPVNKSRATSTSRDRGTKLITIPKAVIFYSCIPRILSDDRDEVLQESPRMSIETCVNSRGRPRAPLVFPIACTCAWTSSASAELPTSARTESSWKPLTALCEFPGRTAVVRLGAWVEGPVSSGGSEMSAKTLRVWQSTSYSQRSSSSARRWGRAVKRLAQASGGAGPGCSETHR